MGSTLLIAAGASLLALSVSSAAEAQAPINPPSVVQPGGVGSFADIVDRVAPAVVTIDTRPARRRTAQACAPAISCCKSTAGVSRTLRVSPGK